VVTALEVHSTILHLPCQPYQSHAASEFDIEELLIVSKWGRRWTSFIIGLLATGRLGPDSIESIETRRSAAIENGEGIARCRD